MKELLAGIKCNKCGFCRAVCPLFDLTRLDSYAARGKLALIEGVAEKKLSAKDVAERLFQCTNCKACYAECPAGVEADAIIERARAKLVDAGAAPAPHRRMAKNARDTHNPFGESPEKRAAWLPSGSNRIFLRPEVRKQMHFAEKNFAPAGEGAEVGYFAGCFASYRMPKVATNAVRILQKVGVNFTILASEEYCCGSPFLRTGQEETAKALIRHNIMEIKKRGIETLIFSCAGCMLTFSRDYPEWAKKLHLDYDLKAVHISQFMDKLIKEHRLKFVKSVSETVTYHDPCHIGRHLGIYDEPRNVLRAIPGLRLVEMEHSMTNALCCGGGGGVRSAYKEIADALAKKRLEEAKKSGAKTLVSCCTLCEYSFIEAKNGKSGRTPTVKDLIDLALKAMG